MIIHINSYSTIELDQFNDTYTATGAEAKSYCENETMEYDSLCELLLLDHDELTVCDTCSRLAYKRSRWGYVPQCDVCQDDNKL